MGKKLLIILLFFISFALWGELKIEMSSDSQNYTLDDTISLTIAVTSDSKPVEIKRFPAPDNLMLLAKSKSTSQRIEVVNGETFKEISVIYSLTYSPSSVGKIKIDPISITEKGTVYTSNSLTLNIVEKSSDIKDDIENGDKKYEWPFDNEMFIVAQADKNTVYQGEQVTIKYYLYYRTDVDFAEQPALPSFKDFWIEELSKNKFVTNRTTKVYKGYYFKVTTIAQVAVFPMKAGEIDLPPFSAKFKGDVFSSMLSSSPNTIYKRTSNFLKLTVKPLPEEGKPDNFITGNVGNFTFSAILSKTNVSVNEPITLKMIIKGKGNIKNISFPKISENIDGFKLYEPIEKTNLYDDSVISGEKEYSIAIKPEKEGTFTPFDLSFSYFDPQKEKYVVLDYNNLEITVNSNGQTLKTTEQNTNNINSVQTNENNQNTILTTIKPINETYQSNVNYENIIKLVFIFLLFLLPLIYMLISFIIKAKLKNVENQSFILSKNAYKNAVKSLNMLKKETNDISLFYQKFYQITAEYLINRFAISIKGLTTEQIGLFLEKKNIKESEIRNLLNQIENSEFIRFSNMKVTQSEMFESIENIKAVLLKIEEETK